MDELQAWAASLPPHEETAPMDKIDTSTALLPCPFCGGDDLYFPHGTDPAVIECSGCGARSGVPDDQTKAEATAKWNRRALVPALIAERDDLRALVAELQSGQTYRYIGKDGKSVLARTLEDERDDLRAKLDAAVDGLGRISAHYTDTGLAAKHMGAIARAIIAKIKGADHE